MASKKLGSRAERREEARRLERLGRAQEQLFRLTPGGSAETPLRLGSASQVEVQAGSTPCPRCEGKLRLVEHAAETVDARRLRVLRMVCSRCGAARTLYYSVAAEPLN